MTKRYYPEKFNTITSADDIGSLIDLPRITGEDLYSYKKRILESSERVANSSYEGLINGINRELNLERKEVIEITLRDQIYGNLENQNIQYSEDLITDNRSFSETINGASITAIGNVLTSPSFGWSDHELVGLSMIVNGKSYLIKENKDNKVYLDKSELSDLVGQSYQIRANWEENSLIGLSLTLDGQKYLIVGNTNNTIRLNTNIKVNQKMTYNVTSTRPRIEITSSRILLYKDYLNEDNFQVDLEIPIESRNLPHSNIVEKINNESKFFFAENLIQTSENIPSFSFKQQDSDVKVYNEGVPGSKFFKLENKNIKNGTIKFSETDVFLREIENYEDAPNGPYFNINYKEGIVRSKRVPNGLGRVSYTYSNIPFRIEATPAVIVPFADKESESLFFAQKEKRLYSDSRDRFISSQPKSKMIEYISELLSVKDQTWGE